MISSFEIRIAFQQLASASSCADLSASVSPFISFDLSAYGLACGNYPMSGNSQFGGASAELEFKARFASAKQAAHAQLTTFLGSQGGDHGERECVAQASAETASQCSKNEKSQCESKQEASKTECCSRDENGVCESKDVGKDTCTGKDTASPGTCGKDAATDTCGKDAGKDAGTCGGKDAGSTDSGGKDAGTGGSCGSDSAGKS
ncbi:MAG: hypothetical protein AB7S38_13790 [Vulcanimicrobiota bacterium]